jgi:nitroreductase
MEAIQAILTRRSIRKFKETTVSDDVIEKIVDCGLAAPSARDKQPWHLIVVKNRETLKAIQKVHPSAKMLDKAAFAVVVCGDSTIESEMGYIALNCAAMTQNMLVAANALGLGSVWLGLFARKDREEGVRKVFNLPSHIIPVSIAAIGLSDETPEPANRQKEGKLHKEQF